MPCYTKKKKKIGKTKFGINKKTKKKFKMTKATAAKIVKNPNTPAGLKKYYKTKFKI